MSALSALKVNAILADQAFKALHQLDERLARVISL
jgi:hypothetical protein